MHEHIRIPRILWSQIAPSKVFVVKRNICEKNENIQGMAMYCTMQIICNAKRNICEKMDN
jgi:hypothetical protein